MEGKFISEIPEPSKPTKLIHQLRKEVFEKNTKHELGSVVLVKRKTHMGASSNSIYGVVIHSNHKFVRIRTTLVNTGVELKIPLNSPYVESITTLSPESVGGGEKVPENTPNLLRLREKPEEISRFINPVLLTEKGRQQFMKKLNK